MQGRMTATVDSPVDERASAARRAEPLHREEAARGIRRGRIRTSDLRGRSRSR